VSRNDHLRPVASVPGRCWLATRLTRRVRNQLPALSADMRSSPVADKFFPADGHEISPAAAMSSPQN
jgi:hypothetical protein